MLWNHPMASVFSRESESLAELRAKGLTQSRGSEFLRRLSPQKLLYLTNFRSL